MLLLELLLLDDGASEEFAELALAVVGIRLEGLEEEDDLDPLNFNFPPMTAAEILATGTLEGAELLLMMDLVVPSEESSLRKKKPPHLLW